MLRAVLTNSSLVEIKDTVAVLECPSRFVPGARSRLPELAGVFERALGRRVEVRIVEAGIADPTDAGTREHPAPPAPESGSGASPASVASPHGAPPAPSGDPLVRLALELFNARIVSVQPHGGRPAAP